MQLRLVEFASMFLRDIMLLALECLCSTAPNNLKETLGTVRGLIHACTTADGQNAALST